MSTPIDRIAVPTDADFGFLDRLLRTRLLEQMRALRDCQVTVIDDLGESVLGHPAQNSADTLRATLRVHDPAFYRAVAGNGSVGAGEAYIDGHWECDDLVALIRVLVRNRDLLDAMETGLARFGGIMMRAWHALRRNTRGGSRNNIAAHYDLGNDFFGTFLDDNLMYSSAIFASADESLDVASTRKLDRILPQARAIRGRSCRRNRQRLGRFACMRRAISAAT
jgi:cyclopropane-fatty-acyl-phospholipid synthase